MSLQRRLEDLERHRLRSRNREPSEARGQMVEHLDRVAALRRGELGPEEAAEVETMSMALEDRMASRRGVGS